MIGIFLFQIYHFHIILPPNRMNNISPYNIIFGDRIKLPIERMFSKDVFEEGDKIAQDKRHTTGIRGSKNFAINSGHRAYMDKMKHYYHDLDEYIKLNRASYHQEQQQQYDRVRIPPTHYGPFEPVWIDYSVGMVGNEAKLPILINVVRMHT